MLGEVVGLVLDGELDIDVVDDVLLTTVPDSDEAETERDLLVHEHAAGVGAFVHDVDFGDDADGPPAAGVELAGHQEGVAGGHVLVGGDDAQDDGPLLPRVVHAHVLGDLLDVLTLVVDRNLGDARQVHDGQVGTGAAEDGQNDGLVHDLLLAARHFVGQLLDLLLHDLEVLDFLVGQLLELGVRLVVGPVRRSVHQSHLQRPSCAHSLASGQTVHAHDRFQKRRLARRLSAHHRDRRQLYVLLKSHVSQFVYHCY